MTTGSRGRKTSYEWHIKHSYKALKILRKSGARFCKIYEGTKRPVGNAWTDREETYSGGRKLKKWITKGGNYGIVGGYENMTMLDEDDPRIIKARRENLPKTFVVSTCHNDRHSYFKVPDLDGSFRLQDPKDPSNVVGDIQDKGKQVVGPGSVVYPEHDVKTGEGGYYNVVNNAPVAEITQGDIKEAFGDYIDIRDRVKRGSGGDSKFEPKEDEIDITEVGKIKKAIDRGDLELKKGGKWEEYYVGPHPIHGSKTGQNFHVIPKLNCWRCWRNGHNSGGGPYYWIAVEEGIIDCKEAYKDSPALLGKKFNKVLQIAVDRGLITEEQARVVGIISPETSEEVGDTVKEFKI